MHRFNLFAKWIFLLFISAFAKGQGPSLFWSLEAGNIPDDVAHAITSDDSGYIYTTGMIDGTVDIDPGPAVYNIGGSGKSVFVLKQDNTGAVIC